MLNWLMDQTVFAVLNADSDTKVKHVVEVIRLKNAVRSSSVMILTSVLKLLTIVLVSEIGKAIQSLASVTGNVLLHWLTE